MKEKEKEIMTVSLIAGFAFGFICGIAIYAICMP